mgnify:CR=1 FL=1
MLHIYIFNLGSPTGPVKLYYEIVAEKQADRPGRLAGLGTIG